MHVESVRRHFFDLLSPEQLDAASHDIQMTLLDHLLPLANATRRRAHEDPRGSPCPARALTGPDAPVRMRSGGLLPYCIVAGSMSLGYGSIYTLLADLRDRYGFTEAQLGYIVAAGFLAGFVTQLALARLADRGLRTDARARRDPPRDGRDDRQRGWPPSSGPSCWRASCSGSAAARSGRRCAAS